MEKVTSSTHIIMLKHHTVNKHKGTNQVSINIIILKHLTRNTSTEGTTKSSMNMILLKHLTRNTSRVISSH
jgi:hypothetical protein